jgi:hypothetical protein
MINWQELESQADELRRKFENADPFRYVVFENLLDSGSARRIESGFEIALAHKDHGAPKAHRNVLRKAGTPNLKLMTEDQVAFFHAVNSDRFCELLQRITGIDTIYSDMELRGGGLHSSVRGGYLNVHTDFNFHPVTNAHRRLNLICYVNSEWEESWGGVLELWNEDVTECKVRVLPQFNRAVLFETSEISFHGHPVPLNSPEGVARKSLAVYYYSDWPADLEQRAKTNYVLTPDQKATLRAEILRAIAAGARDAESVSEMISGFQLAHVKQLFNQMRNVRA